MRIVALFSGGKDSHYALWAALQEGHELVALITIKSSNPESFMYHLPNIHLTIESAKAMGFPLVIGETEEGPEKELEILEAILADLKKKEKIEGVVSGAIRSNYQKTRIDNICKKLKLKSLAPLWQIDERKYLDDLYSNGFDVMIVGCYALGFTENFLGKMIDKKTIEELMILEKDYRISPVGEGGEMETFVLDSPMHKYKIEILGSKKHWEGSRGELHIHKVQLVPK